MIDMNLAFIDDLSPMDINLTPFLLVVGIFVGLGSAFLLMQMRKEYHWVNSLGGVDSIFDVDDI